MSVLDDLVNQIEDVSLRERIAKEVDRLAKQNKDLSVLICQRVQFVTEL